MSDTPIFEPESGTTPEIGAAVTECIESGCRLLLLDEENLPGEVFDLSTRVLGDAVQRATNYGIQMALVVRDPGRYSDAFQQFVREASGRGAFGCFRTREEAVEWLDHG